MGVLPLLLCGWLPYHFFRKLGFALFWGEVWRLRHAEAVPQHPAVIPYRSRGFSLSWCLVLCRFVLCFLCVGVGRTGCAAESSHWMCGGIVAREVLDFGLRGRRECQTARMSDIWDCPGTGELSPGRRTDGADGFAWMVRERSVICCAHALVRLEQAGLQHNHILLNNLIPLAQRAKRTVTQPWSYGCFPTTTHASSCTFAIRLGCVATRADAETLQ